MRRESTLPTSVTVKRMKTEVYLNEKKKSLYSFAKCRLL